VDTPKQTSEAIIEGFSDEDCMVQADVEFNTGYRADILFRYTDTNNHYGLQINHTPVAIAGFYKVDDGVLDTWSGCYYTTGEPMAVKIKVNGSSLKVPALDSPPLLEMTY